MQFTIRVYEAKLTLAQTIRQSHFHHEITSRRNDEAKAMQYSPAS